jgi:hypothetical protein
MLASISRIYIKSEQTVAFSKTFSYFIEMEAMTISLDKSLSILRNIMAMASLTFLMLGSLSPLPPAGGGEAEPGGEDEFELLIYAV